MIAATSKGWAHTRGRCRRDGQGGREERALFDDGDFYSARSTWRVAAGTLDSRADGRGSSGGREFSAANGAVPNGAVVAEG